METIYIGSDFKQLRLRTDGVTLTEAPYVVLFNKQKQVYYAADSVVKDGDEYNVDWLAATTYEMIAGIYTLEVYTDSSRTEILLHKEQYAKAITVAASPI